MCSLGAVYTDPDFDPHSIYDEGYFRGEQASGYADYPGSEAVIRAEFRRTLSHLRKHGADEGRLLEIGSAYGFLLLEAAPFFVCTGVEVSPVALAAARARGLAVFRSWSEPAVVSRGPYDAALMLDCIEHLAEPDAAVAAAHSLLRTGGALLVTTGDWGSPLARLSGRRWRLMTPPQHLWFFDRHNLLAMLERLGFESVHVDRPTKIVAAGLAAYQLTRRLGLSIPLPSLLLRLGIPVNLFDTVRVVARKRDRVLR